MLQLDGVTIRQGNFRLAADWEVGPGITAIIGPSGGGKSTLLASIGGFVTPETGRVRWNEADLTSVAPGARPVSVLFQDNNLFPHLTVEQNAGLALHPNLRLSPRDKARVQEALSQVGLSGMEQRKPASLSGGQQSRAALARVLLADRPVVLLDEPFAALGPGLKADMLELVRATLAASGKTILMVTHDPLDAKAVATQIVLVADGTAAAPAPTNDVFANPPPALRNYLGGG